MENDMEAKIIGNELMTGNIQAAIAIPAFWDKSKYYWKSETHKREGAKCFPTIELCLKAAAKTLKYKII
jgi:hypothetical protein